jgi:hypothetical protein
MQLKVMQEWPSPGLYPQLTEASVSGAGLVVTVP